MIAKIKELWKTVSDLWNKRGFEIFLGLCVAFILIIALYNKIKGKKGTYSKGRYYVPPSKSNYTPRSRRPPPRESAGEKECRRVLQRIFRKPFPSRRPDFLRNPVTGGNFNLELDCYNAELALAVEYNGRQHYEYTPHFHRNKEHFLNQKYRDDMKRRITNQNRVVLIEVPYTVKVPKIQSFLVQELRKKGYKV